MSLSGKYTPLQLNTLSGLLKGDRDRITGGLDATHVDRVFVINPRFQGFAGVWSRSQENTNIGSYTWGSLISSTVLNHLTQAIIKLNGYSPGGTLNLPVNRLDMWRRLISVGNGVVNALGNSRPSSFIRTYPNYHDPYPSDNYPQFPSPDNGSQTVSNTNYGWITGWNDEEYEFCANFDPSAVCQADVYFGQGYLALYPRQGFFEFWDFEYETRPNHYLRLTRSIGQHKAWAEKTNRTIASFKNTQSFQQFSHTSINDHTSADISGVSLAFRAFGSDLINLGKAVNLADIEYFGRTDKFLIHLQSNNALTEAVRLALVAADLSITDLNAILIDRKEATVQQLKNIWTALGYITGSDLAQIKTILNVKTAGLTSLQDLLTVNKMFPESHNTITVPEWRTDTAAAKIYDFIYVNGGLNSRLKDHSEYLLKSLPDTVALAAAAFSYTLRQIKGIYSWTFERFAQVVAQLEVTNKDLSLTNSPDGIPGNKTNALKAMSYLQLGSGNSGTYCMTDFTGCISGDQYNDIFAEIQNLLIQAATPLLATIYHNIYKWAVDQATQPTQDSNGVWSNYTYDYRHWRNYDSTVYPDYSLDTYLQQAEAEISNIFNSRRAVCDRLNYWWTAIGTILSQEQRAIPFSAPECTRISGYTNREELYQFIANLENWADQTDYKEIARLIEKIADLSTVPGQSMVALLRESRNAKRIALLGGQLDNDVSDSLKPSASSATALVSEGKLTDLSIDSTGFGYDVTKPPRVYAVSPVGTVPPKISPVLSTFSSADNTADRLSQALPGAMITALKIDSPGDRLPDNLDIIIEEPVLPTSLALPADPLVIPVIENLDIVPKELVMYPSNSYTPDEAIENVTICNCDCWTI